MTTPAVSIVNFIEALAQRNSKILCTELQEKSANLTSLSDRVKCTRNRRAPNENTGPMKPLHKIHITFG